MACSYNGDSMCTPCAAGGYSSGGGATACTRCPSGSVVVDVGVGLLSATITAKNTTQNNISISRCTACKNYANAEQTACVNACLPGSYASSLHACSMCPEGSVSPSGISCTACIGCPNANKTRCLPIIECMSSISKPSILLPCI